MDFIACRQSGLEICEGVLAICDCYLEALQSDMPAEELESAKSERICAAMENGIRQFCCPGFQERKNGKIVNQYSYDRSWHLRLLSIIDVGVSDRAAEAATVGRLLRQRRVLLALRSLSDDSVHEILSHLKTLTSDELFSKLQWQVFGKQLGPGKSFSYSPKDQARMIAAQLGVIEAMQGTGKQVLETTLRDYAFADHRFHSVFSPWSATTMTMLGFLRKFSNDVNSEHVDGEHKRAALETLRCIPEFESMAFVGMVSTYTHSLLPYIDEL